MTTATKPKRATKKKPDDLPATETPDVETAGGPESTDSPAREPLIARLAKLGFVVSDDDLTDAELVTAREWLDGKDFPATDVPEFLRDYEGVDAPLMQVALDAGKAKGQAGASENTCPYPPGTIMRAYWTDGFKDGMLAKEVAREVGEFIDVPDRQRAAELGEVFIFCSNIESAKVLKHQATEVVRAFELRAMGHAEARKGTE